MGSASLPPKNPRVVPASKTAVGAARVRSELVASHRKETLHTEQVKTVVQEGGGRMDHTQDIHNTTVCERVFLKTCKITTPAWQSSVNILLASFRSSCLASALIYSCVLGNF